MLGDNTMKITRARLKQIIKEEMNNLDLDEQRISSEDDAAVEGHAGKTCKEVHPDMTHPEYMKKKLDEQSKMEESSFLPPSPSSPATGKGDSFEGPREEPEATGREKKSASAVDAGGKLGQEEFKNMLANLLKSKKVMPADRKAALVDMFGPVGAKIHQALLAEK